ncbi:MAG: carboxypeptidase-like regulatory domain-containing protein, partial [Gemmatimonadota bacterium]
MVGQSRVPSAAPHCDRGTAGRRAVPPQALFGFLLVLTMPGAVAGQTFQGRVLGSSGEGPVPTALVRLVDEGGEQRAISIADSAGFYRLRAPAPGVYRLEAERVGYRPVESPLLEAGSADGVYPIDLEMVSAPVELRGLTVEADRLSEERADRSVQMITGLSPKSLRFRPVTYEMLQDHLARAHLL